MSEDMLARLHELRGLLERGDAEAAAQVAEAIAAACASQRPLGPEDLESARLLFVQCVASAERLSTQLTAAAAEAGTGGRAARAYGP